MDLKEKQHHKMLDTPVPKLIMTLAVPTIFSMLITSIYNLADTFFVGQISTSASGAIGVVSSLMAVIQAIGFMFGHGAGSIISRSLGNNDAKAASRFASTSFFTAILFGGILGVFGLIFIDQLADLLGSTPTILPHATAYARYILFAAPVMMSSLVMNNVLRYEGRASFAMVGLVTGGLMNMALDPLFIFVCDMGTAGAGLATAVSQCVSFCILLSMFLRGKTVSKLSIKNYTHSVGEFFRIMLTGLPSLGRQGLGSLAGILLNVAARAYGDAAVAGMSIVSRIFLFIMAVVIGIGQGFQPVAGYNYGAKRYDRVHQATLFTLAMGTIAVVVISAICFIFAEPLVRLFRDDSEVVAIALPAFRLQCAVMILQPTYTVTNMLLQSVGKSVRATLIACSRQGLFFIPLILILPSVWGITGVEVAQSVADVLTFLFALPFFLNFLRHLKKLSLSDNQEGVGKCEMP